MIALKALALAALILVPGWLAVSLLRGGKDILDNRERLFLAAALGTGIVAVSALLLALASIYNLARLLALVGSISVLLALAARKRVLWIRRLGLKDLLFTLAVVAVALVLFAPPGRTVFGWSDVGVYPNIAAHIQREGGIAVQNSTSTRLDEEYRDYVYYPKRYEYHPEASFENQFFVIDDFDTGKTSPWFYFLWPAFIAVFASFLGIAKEFWAVTAVGVLSFWGFFLLARRLLGGRWAIAAAALAALSPLMLYFSRYTTSEMMNLVFFLGASICIMAYLRAEDEACKTRLAAASSFFFTLAFLCRIDFLFILIPLAICYVIKKIFSGFSRADWCFCGLTLAGAGLSVLMGAFCSRTYFLTLWSEFVGPLNRFFTPLVFVLITAIFLVFIFADKLRPIALRLFRATRLWVPLVWIFLAAMFIYLYCVRPGGTEVIIDYGFIKGIQGPSYLKQNLVRWAWYLSFPGLLLLFAGYGMWFSRRRRFGEFALGFIGLSFTLLYALDMRSLPMHILSMRRLIPVILPIGLLMMVYVLRSLIEVPSKFIKGRGLRKLVRSVLTVGIAGLLLYLLLFSANASIPIFGLEEGGNQLELCAEISGDVKEGGTVIMDYYLGDLFGPPLRCIYGVENTWLKENSIMEEPGFLGFLESLGFPDEPVYILWRPQMSGKHVNLIEGLEVEPVGEYTSYEDTLEKSFVHRPSRREHYMEEVWLLRLNRG